MYWFRARGYVFCWGVSFLSLFLFLSLYLSLYIYIYGHNLNQWAKKRSKFQFFPSFIVKNDPEKPPHQVWGFFTFQCFVFLLIFAFSCLIFSSFPLLLDFLKPKSGPLNEVIGIYIYLSLSPKQASFLVKAGRTDIWMLVRSRSETLTCRQPEKDQGATGIGATGLRGSERF